MLFNGGPSENGAGLAPQPSPVNCQSQIVTEEVGYTRDEFPNDACPERDGCGIPQVWIKDVYFLTDEERALAKCMQKTRYGARFRFHDQLKALNVLAQHLQIKG